MEVVCTPSVVESCLKRPRRSYAPLCHVFLREVLLVCHVVCVRGIVVRPQSRGALLASVDNVCESYKLVTQTGMTSLIRRVAGTDVATVDGSESSLVGELGDRDRESSHCDCLVVMR